MCNPGLQKKMNKPISFKKEFFARNRHREEERSDIFNITYKSLAFIGNILLPVIFTPAIIISNLVSHGIFLTLLNSFLALGYCAHFSHRFLLDEASYLELLISLVFITALFSIAFYSAPMSFGFNLLNIINVINLLSTSVNSFFLIRNYIVPPLQSFLQTMLHFLGLNVTVSFFSKEPLTLLKDRPVIDRLLTNFYGCNSFQATSLMDKIKPFNLLLAKMVAYVNKYSEPFLGALYNRDKIANLEKSIDQLTIEGNAESSISFIKKKINFKLTKINLLQTTIDTIEKHDDLYRFFRHTQGKDAAFIVKEGTALLQIELDRQHSKVEALRLCIPGK